MSLASHAERPPPARASLAERAGHWLFALMIAFLAFVSGAMVMLFEVFPSDFLRNSYSASQALAIKREMKNNIFASDLWYPARTGARGITVHEPTKAMPGYTLFTSGDGPYARLIDMEGRTVFEWRKPFSEVWHKGAAVKDPQPDSMVYMRKARVMPNGDLLAIYIGAGDTPWGYGMVKLDRDSNVIWSYLENAHHDFDVAPDGRIFLLTHSFTSKKIEGLSGLGRPRLDDFLVTLSADGKELKKLSLTDALARSPYRSYLHAAPAFPPEDPLHANTARYIDAEAAHKLPMAREGQVLVSFRNLGVIAIVDPETGMVTWAVRGPWLGQHDPRPLPNGHILLFDNLGAMNRNAGNLSRVIEFDPLTMAITWLYDGSGEEPFETVLRGSADRLANGNTLITEDGGGRIFEVTREGRIVWEYINPVRTDGERPHIPVLSWGQRHSAEVFDAGFRSIIEKREEALP